jgi:hypothetical protein
MLMRILRSRRHPSQLPGWLASAAVFEWVTLQSPSDSGIAQAAGISGTIAGIINAYSGCALRKNGSWYIAHGGGHLDYEGNDILGMRLEDENPVWQRLWGPTPAAQMQNENEMLDGNPGIPHTYYTNWYDDANDRLMRFGSGRYGPNPGTGPGVYSWPWMGENWNPANTHPSVNIGATNYSEVGSFVMAPNGDVWATNVFRRYHWRNATNDWATALDRDEDLGANPLIFDTSRNVIWSFRHETPGFVTRWNVGTNQTEDLLELSGDAADWNSLHMGADYDPVSDRGFLCREQGGVAVFNPSALSLNEVTTTGTAPSTETSSNAFMPHGKFRYVPNLGGIVFCAQWQRPTFFIRTH